MKSSLLILIVTLLIGAFAVIPSTVRAETIGGMKVFVDVSTMKEHMEMMKMMKLEMEMEPGATHHLSVNLESEKTGEKITEAEISVSCISSDGKEIYSGTMGYMPKMAHFGENITLKDKGKYYIKIVVYLKEIAVRYSVTLPFTVM